MRRTLGLILSLAVEWSLVGDEWNLIATALPAAVTDATPAQGRATPIQRRKAEYKAAYDAAERDGKAVYRSDGLIGQPLPKGLYELIRHKGEVWFIEVKPAGVPVPKPDPAALFRGEDCLT